MLTITKSPGSICFRVECCSFEEVGISVAGIITFIFASFLPNRSLADRLLV